MQIDSLGSSHGDEKTDKRPLEAQEILHNIITNINEHHNPKLMLKYADRLTSGSTWAKM